MTTTTYQNTEGYNYAINALKADYETKLQALRHGTGIASPGAIQKGGRFVRNHPALVISSTLTIGLLVGAIIGRRSNRQHSASQ